MALSYLSNGHQLDMILSDKLLNTIKILRQFRARYSLRFDDNYLITLSLAEKLMSVTIQMIPEARCFITLGTYFQRFD